MFVATLVTLALNGSDADEPDVIVDLLATAAQDAGETATRTSAPATPPATTPDVAGLAFPIAGGCLPQDDNLMPGAPREYRDGTHEGLDFYDSDNCTAIGIDTEVLAAKAGTVIRADVDYVDLTAEELLELEERVANGEGSAPDILDAYRGRQVWIDHGGGVVTRYCHLNGIAEGIEAGVEVEQGRLIGYVGESGAPESVTDPGTQLHLHFEVRVGDSYLGAGLAPEDVRALYERAFGVR
jgi:murein DD-endopeptidase MepM/ murein hydrolase activator NlpD